jgi:hypothetical protein
MTSPYIIASKDEKCIIKKGEFCPAPPAGKWCWNCGHSLEGIARSLQDYKGYAKKHPLYKPLTMFMEASP